MRRLFRFAVGILLPAILILLGLLILTGCIFIPGFHETVARTNVAAKVGGAQSQRPIRVGFATRQQIISMFGPPQYADYSGRRIGYSWVVRNGVWLFPLCFTATPRLGYHGIELDFDDHDVLRNFKLVADDPETGPNFAIQTMRPQLDRPPFDPALHPSDHRSSDHRFRPTTQPEHIIRVRKCPTAPTSSTN